MLEHQPFPGRRETRQWIVVASLLLSMILVAGPTFGSYGVFFDPLLREFKLSRTEVSSLSGALFLAMGLSAPLIGWMLDRIDARIVTMAGTVLCIAGFVVAGRAHSLHVLLVAHILMGVGVNAATIISTPYVIANWFGARRSTALGIAFVGLAAGPMSMTILANHLVSALGWRSSYLLLMIPMAAVVLPVQLVFIRSRPPWGVETTTAGSAVGAAPLSGFEVREAIATRSFWLILSTNFCFGFATTALSVHAIPYLINIGYKPAAAAWALGVTFGFSAPGNVFFGWLGDKVRSRFALSMSLAAVAASVLLLLGASNIVALGAFVVIYGVAHQGPVFGVPLTIAECLGLKRFGSLSGLIGFVTTVAGSVGPIAAGRLFDITGSYTAPLALFVVSLIVASVLPLACSPFSAWTTPDLKTVAVGQ